GTVYVDPQLPPWCPELRMDNIRVGEARLTLIAVRREDGSCEIDVDSRGGSLVVVRGRAPWLDVPAGEVNPVRDDPAG
ncbi:MAG TPA: hypothetical protein VH134_00650, partial [Candidatus Dormibacteraeota bacterium]|nr:hypothetical protein [Candidatus Dormibacteraeota bacterium]